MPCPLRRHRRNSKPINPEPNGWHSAITAVRPIVILAPFSFTKRLAATSHTMALEAQGIEKGDESEQLKRLVRQIIEKAGSGLWEEES